MALMCAWKCERCWTAPARWPVLPSYRQNSHLAIICGTGFGASGGDVCTGLLGRGVRSMAALTAAVGGRRVVGITHRPPQRPRLSPPPATAVAAAPSRTSAADSSAAAAAGLTADLDVEAIARMAMRQMGKEYGAKQEELVEKLREEMYDTAAAFSELREELLPGLAQQWKAPHRLLATMHRIAADATSQTSGATAIPVQEALEPPVLCTAPSAHGTAVRTSTTSEAPPPGGQVAVVEVSRMGMPSPPPPPPPLDDDDDEGDEKMAIIIEKKEKESGGFTGGIFGDDISGGGGGGDEEEAVDDDDDENEEEGGEESLGGSEGAFDIDLGALGGGGILTVGGGDVASSSQYSGGAGASAASAEEEEAEEEEQQEEEEEEREGKGSNLDLRQLRISERRCPSKFRFGHGSGREVRLTERRRGEPYSIKEAETPPALAAELREFESFSLYGSFAGAHHGEPLRRTTCQGYVQCVRQALGWLHRIEGVPLEELRLALLVPGTQRGAARRVHAFLMWQERDRGMCKRSVARSLAALIQLAKFLFHEQSQVREGDKPYSDLEVIKSLRAMYMSYERANRVSGHVVDSSVKWMDWPAYLAYVGELRKECAALKANGRPRSPVDVAMSLQTYLIAAILSCVPDRQRTLRELVVGRTLVKDKNGMWSIRHSHADYKTGGTYGERPPLVIDPGVYYELEEFINTWRAHLKPQHNFLFSKRDGSAPLTAQELSRSFSLNAFRITGRKLNPHMVRDMVVTYARSGHASEHELEALAIYMGHSLAEQRGTYDRRTKAQKVQPAMGLLAKISGAAVVGATAAAAAGVTGPAGGAGVDEALATQLGSDRSTGRLRQARFASSTPGPAPLTAVASAVPQSPARDPAQQTKLTGAKGAAKAAASPASAPPAAALPTLPDSGDESTPSVITNPTDAVMIDAVEPVMSTVKIATVGCGIGVPMHVPGTRRQTMKAKEVAGREGYDVVGDTGCKPRRRGSTRASGDGVENFVGS